MNAVSTHARIASDFPWMNAPADQRTAANTPPARPGHCVCESGESYRQGVARFEDGMMRVLAERAGDLPPEDRALIKARAQHQLRAIVRQVFGAAPGTGQECITRGEMNARVERAGKVAGAAFDEAVAEAMDRLIDARTGHATRAPQIVRRANGGFNLIRRVPPIESLVITGGGAKGIGLGGALLALEDAGMLDNLRAVAGSSVGALMGIWLVVGRSVDELNGLLAGDLRQLLATDNALNAIYPDIRFRSTARLTAKLLSPFGATHDTATGMIRKLDEVTATEVSAFLKTYDRTALYRDVRAAIMRQRQMSEPTGRQDVSGQDVSGQDVSRQDVSGRDVGRQEAERQAVEQQAQAVLARLAVLARQPDFNRSRAGLMVTFADLSMLHTLAPAKFRRLSLSVHDTSTRRNVIFDARSAPNLPIAYAARASMAHPLIATGVSFPAYGPAAPVFSDGGISSNVPTEALVPATRPRSNSVPSLPRPPDEQRRHAAVAVVAFDDNGKTDDLIYGPPPDSRKLGFFQRLGERIAYSVAGWVASNPAMAATSAADQRKLHDFGPNVINVKHGDLTTMDIDADRRRKQAAIAEARADMSLQLKMVRGDLYAVEVASVADAFRLLDEDEKRLLCEESAGAASDRRDPSGMAQQALRNMARMERDGTWPVPATRREADLENWIDPLLTRLRA